MSKHTILILAVVAFLLRCESKPVGETIVFFKKGSLSKNPEQDSMSIAFFSPLLVKMSERPLNTLEKESDTYRLIVVPSFYDPYIIRVTHINGSTTVAFKMSGGQSGLSKLSLIYESETKPMDSLYRNLVNDVGKYEFYNWLDDPRNYYTADGTSYLLESRVHGVYKVVEGRKIDIDYKGRKDFVTIVENMHRFLPPGFLPNFEKAKTLEDILFPTLRSGNKVKSFD